jgi:hypothetical protein
MPDWLNQLKSGLRSSAVPQAHLAAFGKHPGWDDHLDDLGLDTEPLLAAKQYLYILGIGGAVDAGAWENGQEGDVLPGFKHLFVWTGGSDLVIGRMWSSSDGKNRTRYPMVVCAHFQNADFDSVLYKTAGMLARIETECRATASPADVGRILRAGHDELQGFLASPAPAPSSNPGFKSKISEVSGAETLPRLAYAFDTYLGPFATGKVNRKEMSLNLKLHQVRTLPQHLRVPGDAGDPVGALRFWRKLLAGLIDDSVPLFILAPIEERWIDLIAGPLTAQQLVCIRMTPKLAPLSSDVPYTLNDKAAIRAGELFSEAAA